MKRILDLFFSDNPEFTIKFVVSMITAIALLMVSLGAQTTFTDEEMINLENDFIYLENKVDSLTYQDSLKAIMITTLEEEIKLTNEQLALTEKKRMSWLKSSSLSTIKFKRIWTVEKYASKMDT